MSLIFNFFCELEVEMCSFDAMWGQFRAEITIKESLLSQPGLQKHQFHEFYCNVSMKPDIDDSDLQELISDPESNSDSDLEANDSDWDDDEEDEGEYMEAVNVKTWQQSNQIKQ